MKYRAWPIKISFSAAAYDLTSVMIGFENGGNIREGNSVWASLKMQDVIQNRRAPDRHWISLGFPISIDVECM